MGENVRESVDYDVVIVGAGPAGLSAAIRLKQINKDLNVVVLEKGSEVGAHILSGAVLDPVGINRLLPDWKNRGAPIKTEVTKDKFMLLGAAGGITIPNFPMPPLMNNHGNYIVSMANVCRWLGDQAEELGVEIFPGMSCSDLVYGERGELTGVVAGEFGKNPDGSKGANYEPGMELLAKYVFLSEGARGSLSKKVIAKYKLDEGKQPQKYGLGMKEIWEIKDDRHSLGQVTHTMGWPLGANAGGGSFMYHAEDNQIFLGFVVHLNYKNPSIFPYMEFQRFKHHPFIANILAGGRRISYGARAISEGGWQSIPKLVFPGGALLGCSAGLVNVPRIKGNHNAILSGIEAAQAAASAIKSGRSRDELVIYEKKIRKGYISRDLKRVRNVKPLWSQYGLYASLFLGGVDMWVSSLTGWNPLGNMKHLISDSEATGKSEDFKKIEYPKVDGVLSFDRLTNVSFSGTNHDENQPCHLHLTDGTVPIEINLSTFDEPAQRYCPAGVYEILESKENNTYEFQINSQNCVHCKTCDIKDPSANITWLTPNGGDGPNYPNM